jgi:uncharacterized protein
VNCGKINNDSSAVKRCATIKAKYGADYFSKMGRQGAIAKLEKHGRRALLRMARKGGRATYKKYGDEYMKMLGRVGGSRSSRENKC